MSTTTVRHGALQRRRIIERPRLIALLDGSKARARLLVAGPGYGKTTLADQWIARDGHRGAWFTARRSSTDVAALALGLARASSELVPGCDARLREHLRAVPAPAENVETLAEILGEDLAAWPQGGWLVIDEYQEICPSESAELFVSGLVATAPIHVLIASRQRPAWVTARSILYGDAFELTQSDLAMDDSEAAEVLVGRSAPSASGVVSLANGWPAVIGLASVSHAEVDDRELLPESLYGFFAEEVFGALGSDVQSGLVTLVVAPVLDRALASALLGVERAERVCAAALDVGIIVERGAQLELHPLARSFLAERGEQLGFAPGPEIATGCLEHYRARREWDPAFEVISRTRRTDALEPLLLEALDELLETARLSTLDTWCALAKEWTLEAPVFAIARAEVALRYGRHAEAQAHAEVAASAKGSGLMFRGLSVAGRAAHLASRERDALEIYGRAEAAASTKAERRDARWGQFICSTDLELPETVDALELLLRDVRLSDPREVVRAAAYTLNYQLRFGALDLSRADLARQLIHTVSDPLIESSFHSVYSPLLSLSARYPEGLEVANQLLETARRYRLDFAVPYGLYAAAMAKAGLRDWESAGRSLDEAMEAARVGRNSYAEQIAFALQLRILAQCGRHRDALALEVPSLEGSLPSARAEVLLSRALVMASRGQVDAARATLDEVRGSTRAVEPTVLIAAIEATAAMKRHEHEAIDLIGELKETAFSTGGVDLLVATYRMSPELLTVLLRGPDRDERLVALILRARDEDLASAVGQSIADDDPRSQLSKREFEVFELLRQGLTNRQIAELLFIGESTAKRHTQHVYDKLGIRSRTALTVQALLERSGQATSAMDETGSRGDSELL